MSISNNRVVSFHYTLTDGDGKQLDKKNNWKARMWATS